MGTQPSSAPAARADRRHDHADADRLRILRRRREASRHVHHPALPEDVDLLSRPITYVTYRVKAEDGKSHDVLAAVRGVGRVDGEMCRDEGRSPATWKRSMAWLRCGLVRRSRTILKRKGMTSRIDWGYLYLAAAKEVGRGPCSTRAGEAAGSSPREKQQQSRASKECVGGARDGTRRERRRRSTCRQVGGRTCRAVADVLAYDDLYSIEYMLPPAASLLASQRARCGRTADGSRPRLRGDHEAVRQFRR